MKRTTVLLGGGVILLGVAIFGVWRRAVRTTVLDRGGGGLHS